MTMEKIGKVKLNYSYYSGTDFYSEGNIEEELLECVKKYSKEDFIDVIADRCEWSFLYHLSPIRGNIIEWLPFKSTDSVLEIGAGCGAITETLAKKVSKVTCIELSKRRSEINAYRNKEYDNIEILVGNFEDIESHIEEKYDYITLIGVLEYAASYITGSNPYENFLKIIKKHLKPNGKVIIAIENKFGLKYWAGCKEDHLQKYFEGLENYSETKGVRTFSKDELKKMSDEVGFKGCRFYYPYPDYKLPLTLFSDDYLPKKGELGDNIKNYDQERLQLFDEEKVYDSIIEANMYPFFSNSYLLILSDEENNTFTNQIYVKYNERDRNLDVRTDIVLINGEKVVEKIAMTEEANEHLKHIYESYRLLENNTAKININKCKWENKKLQFEFIEGNTLESKIDYLLNKGQYLEWLEKIKEYFEKIKKSSKITLFKMTNEFKIIFGEINELSNNIEAVEMINIDALPRNIIIDEDDNWNMIDYEWTFNFPIPSKFILFRCLVYYIFENNRQSILSAINVFRVMGITEDEEKLFWIMEKNFQIYVRGKLDKIKNAYQIILKEKYAVVNEIEQNKERIKNESVQIYLDYGEGFCEKNSFFIQYNKNGEYIINLPIGVKNVRLDPSMKECIVKINSEMAYDGSNYKLVRSTHNGINIVEDLILFKDNDAQIYYFDIKENTQYIKICLEKSNIENIIVDELITFISEDDKLKEEKEKIEYRREVLEQQKCSLDEKNNILEQEKYSLENKNKQLQQEKNILEEQKKRLEQEKNTLNDEKTLVYNKYIAIENSFFWRITYVPRKLIDLIRKRNE